MRGILAAYRSGAELVDAAATMLSALADQAAIALVNVHNLRIIAESKPWVVRRRQLWLDLRKNIVLASRTLWLGCGATRRRDTRA